MDQYEKYQKVELIELVNALKIGEREEIARVTF